MRDRVRERDELRQKRETDRETERLKYIEAERVRMKSIMKAQQGP